MKKPLAILLLFIFNICYSQSAKENIIGEWITTDLYGGEGKMIFSNDNFISMSINGEFVDGKNYVIKGGKNDGQKMFMKYEIDDSDLPIKIDIIVIKPENDKNIEKGRILGILDFSNKTETRMILNFNGTRESGFNDSNINDTIYLKRK